ncbi:MULTISPECIES: TetR/AcrR family transcriptional regulator [Streptomyces]|uniref:TetR/AcrR family transcriptional regulator n=1 Tax=Streptomyces TaxID=1883 RepID=UPI00163BCC80|nr:MULTISPECIES: TetR/AcrR family transcriptional regulator [Streptomyces]MBC2875866.1 TetR/AcrR family transcriptional regulator [Streptomyces sp. TYQ1024]UBI37713.1 TetR/AcrR family transcriptional regulator [Streptomyces mobaraensis]UKW30299.1 TetR/AcrR family transcriptional regulator [Streptomyces sp. TYQ1024]
MSLTSTARPRGLPDKRQAISEAARRVFGREGYARASLDVIASEANVAKRTIYNHYADKEDLFLSVAIEGADAVTDAVRALMERHLRKIVDLEEDLTDFCLDRARAITEFPEHFALVRTIHAEVTRLPADFLETWAAHGPPTSHLRLAPYLRKIADRGLLVVDDAARAAHRLNTLTLHDVLIRSYYGAVPLPDAETEEIVTDGVRTFLRLYAPAPGSP